MEVYKIVKLKEANLSFDVFLQEEIRESSEIKEFLKNAIDMLLNLLDGESGSIMLLDSKRRVLNIVSYKGLKEEIARNVEVSLGEGISGYVLNEGNPLILNKGDKFLGRDLSREDINSSIVLPLVSRGKKIGVISINRMSQDEGFSSSDLDFAFLLSRYVVTFLMNLIISHKTFQELTYLKLVYNIFRELKKHKSINCLARIITEGVMKLTDGSLGIFAIYKKENKKLRIISSIPKKEDKELLGLEPVLYRALEKKEKISSSSFLCLPFFCNDEVLGALYVEKSGSNGFTTEQVKAIELVLEEAEFDIKNAIDFFNLKELGRLQERTRMSRELHDRVAQGIAEGVIKSQLTKKFIEKDKKEEIYNEVSALESLLVGVLNEIRLMIFEERPVKMEGKLFDNLRGYIEELNRKDNIEYQLILSGDEGLIFQREKEHIFYIIREALANIRRHSSAMKALIELTIDDSEINLTISDDGKGFDMEQYENRKDKVFGIKIMEERTQLLGGIFKIEGVPYKGTKIEVNIPI